LKVNGLRILESPINGGVGFPLFSSVGDVVNGRGFQVEDYLLALFFWQVPFSGVPIGC